MNRLTLIVLFVFGFVALSSAQKNTTLATAGKHYGQKINPAGSISYENLLERLKTQDSIVIKVKGLVTGVCQVKGCWMNITSAENPSLPPMFVKFQDYAFFMPLDLSGHEVVMQGKAYTEVTTVDELRHYAEDAGKSKEEIAKITEPKSELKFMATGVVLADK
jgi:hypothetical protein